MTQIYCPACGQVNHPENGTCKSCHSFLVTTGGCPACLKKHEFRSICPKTNKSVREVVVQNRLNNELFKECESLHRSILKSKNTNSNVGLSVLVSFCILGVALLYIQEEMMVFNWWQVIIPLSIAFICISAFAAFTFFTGQYVPGAWRPFGSYERKLWYEFIDAKARKGEVPRAKIKELRTLADGATNCC